MKKINGKFEIIEYGATVTIEFYMPDGSITVIRFAKDTSPFSQQLALAFEKIGENIGQRYPYFTEPSLDSSDQED